MDTLRLIWRFESRAARRAFVDTWHFYGDNPMRAVVLATACVLVGSLINYRLHGWESMMAELITWVIYGLAPIGALTLALLMWNFFAAPSKLFDEIQRQLADLHASSNDKDPNLAIQFEPSRHVVMHESGGAGTFRVEAVNTSQKTISGVSIRIVSIAGDTEERTREYQKFVGLRLATTVDPTRETRGRDNMPADEVDLYPGGYQIYDLARLTRSGVSLYHSNYERNKQTQNLDQVPSGYIPAGRVEIGLMAVSRDVNSKIKRFVARRSH